MSKIRDWFRRWLGVEGLSYYATATDQRVDRLRESLHQSQKDLDCNFKREVAIRDTAIATAILKSQGFVPLMNQRIEAVEQTSVNGAGAEAIVRGVMEAYDRKFKGHMAQVEDEVRRVDAAVSHLLTRLQAVEAENVDLAREVDELKKDLIAQAIKPKPKERTEPEKRGREPWPVKRARIEAEEAKQAERN